MREKLLNDFNDVSKSEWEEKIVADLKGKSLDSLLWEAEGLTGGPVYTSEDLEQIENVKSFQNNNIGPNPELFGARSWINYQLVVVDNESRANKIALEALNLGAEGIVFQINNQIDFHILLLDIQLEHCSISFEMINSDPTFLSAYLGYIKDKGYQFSKINGYINSSHRSKEDLVLLSGLVNFKSLNIGLTDEFGGVTAVQELALLLHFATSEIQHFQDSGSSLVKISVAIQFQLRLGKNYFIEIAKIRALKLLIPAMWQGFGLTVSPDHVVILCSSNNWDNPAEDKYNYLLEATTSAMSAILGGCSSLLLRPFHNTFSEQSSLAIRNARNISSILKEEAYLDKNVDPSAGSYYLESITNQLIEKAWTLFLKMEEYEGNDPMSLTKLNNLTSDNK